MKTECNKNNYVNVCVLVICVLLFVGCHSAQDLNDDTTNTTIISTENEIDVSNHTEIEPEIKQKADEDRKKTEAENVEKELLINYYKTYIAPDDKLKIKTLDYEQAKKTIEEIVQRASIWKYYEPGDYYPKGRCSILAKNAADFVGSMTPLIHLYRDNILNPTILVIPGMLASGKPTVQIQLGDSPAETINYTNESGLEIRLTETQYKDIVNNLQDMKIRIIKDSEITTIHVASGNISECVDKIEHRKLNNWEYKEETDAFDNMTYRFCSSVSPNKVYAKLKLDFDRDNKEAPVMVIRQKNHNTPEIILNSRGIQWPSYWNHNIRIKFNDEKPISNSYTMGSGSITTIFLNSEKKLLQRLFTAKRVTFQMPDSKETFSYDLSELPETCKGLDLSGIVK